ncbi:MAG: ABC transporter ATP-binding protein, partial [Ruminococcus sp.]|nr:ABC transporter ATP-binding protein [Ruminococcus sp.]
MNKDVKKLLRLHKLDNMNRLLFMVLMIASTALSVLIPMMFVKLMEEVTAAVSMKSLIMSIGVYFVLNVAELTVGFIFNYYSSVREFEFSQRLKYSVLDKLFLKDGSFFAASKAGDLLTVANDDTCKTSAFVYRVYTVALSLFQAVGVMFMLMYYDCKLSLVLMVMIPVTLLIQRRFGEKLRVQALANRNDHGEQNALTEEFISNSSSMITYGYHKKFLSKYELLTDSLKKSFRKLTLTNGLSNQTIDIVSTISILTIMVIGGSEVFHKQISIGVLVVFLQSCTRFIAPFENLIFMKVSYNMTLPSLDRVYELIFDGDEAAGKKSVDEIEHIKIDKLTFGYVKEKNVLSGLELDFKKNTKYLIWGRSGSGKTTIFNLLLGFWNASSGNIFINNEKISDIDIESFRDRVSYVSQKTFFFHDTIYNNLTSGISKSEEAVWDVLKKVELDDVVKGMENGLDTVLGDDGCTLSGGQRQRMAVARSILKDSDVIIFDEPTSALDKKTEQIIADTITGIKDKIIIIISHSNCF